MVLLENKKLLTTMASTHDTPLCCRCFSGQVFMVSFVIAFLHPTLLPVTWLHCAHCSLRGLRSSLLQCSAWEEVWVGYSTLLQLGSTSCVLYWLNLKETRWCWVARTSVNCVQVLTLLSTTNFKHSIWKKSSVRIINLSNTRNSCSRIILCLISEPAVK